VVVAFVDFLITFAMLVVLTAWYRFLPGWRMLALPGFVMLAFVAKHGPALWITALNVKYRDFRYVVPFIVQFGLYVSPVGFSSIVVPRNGGCSIRRIRWWASSMVFAGAFWVDRASFICRGWR
jgi:lipopolysaccharide transport system permease protein